MIRLLGALLPLVPCLSSTQIDYGYQGHLNSTRAGQAPQQRRALGTAFFGDREVRERGTASQRRSISSSSTTAGAVEKVHEVFGKRLSRAELESLAVYRDRGFNAVPKSFAKQLLCPCWRSDAPFPREVLADIVAKAEKRAQARGRGGTGAKWAQMLMSGAASRFDVGPRRGGGDYAYSIENDLATETNKGFDEFFNTSALTEGGSLNSWSAASSASANSTVNGRRTRQLRRGAPTRRVLSSSTPVSSSTTGMVPGPSSQGNGGGGGAPTRKRRGGRPGSADADAGERVYSLPMYLRDHGVPSSLGWLCLPHFFLLGVPKSGTTALYEMIAAHPQVVRTKKEPHWWTRGQQGDSIVNYVLNNYYSASKDVLQAYTDATTANAASSSPTRMSTSATRTMQESKWLSSETAAAAAAASSNAQPQQMVFGDASASTFWQLQHRPLEPTESRSIVGGLSNRSNVSPAPSVPVLIRAILPHARLIVVFRNPVERALSEYAYFIDNPSAMSPESFTALCSRQVSEFNECRANVRREAASSSSSSFATSTKQDSPIGGGRHEGGVEVDDVLECMYFRAPRRNIRKGFVRVGYGIYVKPLEYWWGIFPRNQLLVLSSDELRSEPASVLQRTLAHLKLSPLSQRDLETTAASPAKVNMRASSRNMKMPRKAALVLGTFYQPFNRELAALTGNNRFLWTPKASDENEN